MVTFKQFSSYVTEAEQEPEKLDEIFGKIFGKAPDIAQKKEQIDAAREKVKAKKDKEKERKDMLMKKRDEAWAKAKETAEARQKPGRGADRDDYALHR